MTLPSSTRFRPDIQGLRAVAVIAVIAYHAGDLLPGGFVGVDVFFVISGFVIMRSLQTEHNRGRVPNLRSFYRRRIRRLTPVLTLTIAVVVPLSIFFGPIGSVETGAKTGMAATLISANLFVGRANGYFGASAELNPLNHTWSLSLEEQFYLIFPAIVLGLFWLARSRGPQKTVSRGLAIFSGLSLGLGLLVSYGPTIGPLESQWAFFLMPTRAWQFGAGAILAVLVSADDSRFSRRGMGAIGAALMLISFIVLNDGMNYPGLWALLPTLATATVIASPGAAMLSPLTRPLMVRMGDVSYSWYLWHWPAMVFAKAAGIESRGLLLIVGLATLPLAMYTYDHVEMRFRVAHQGPSQVNWVRITAASVAVGLAMIMVVNISATAAPAIVTKARDAANPNIGRTCSKIDFAPGLGGCEFGEGSAMVALVGDSNANHFSESIVGAATNLGLRSTILTKNGCPVIDVVLTNDGVEARACAQFSARAREWLVETAPDVVVFAVASDIHLGLDGRVISRGQTQGADAYQEGLREFVEGLAAEGVRVILVDPIPKFSLEPGLPTGSASCSAARLIAVSEGCGLSMTRNEAQNRRSEAMEVTTRALNGTAVVRYDPFDAVCPGANCRELEAGVWQYADTRHTSIVVAEGLIPQFEALLSNSWPSG